MDALRQSIAGEAPVKGKKPRKRVAGQKEMLLPIEGKGGAEKKPRSPSVPLAAAASLYGISE
jgi:DNA end-binding protein Ku